MPFGVSPNGNDFLPSGATTSATTRVQAPTIWSRKVFCCAPAWPVASMAASTATIRKKFTFSPRLVGSLRSLSSGVFRVAIQQLDRNALRPAQEAYLDTRPRRIRLLGELDTLLLEIGGDDVDIADRQPEMIEPLIRSSRRSIHAVAGLDLRGEDIGAAELDVDTRLAGLHGAHDLRAEHALEPLRGSFRIGRAQMNVIPSNIRHDVSPVAICCGNLGHSCGRCATGYVRRAKEIATPSHARHEAAARRDSSVKPASFTAMRLLNAGSLPKLSRLTTS